MKLEDAKYWLQVPIKRPFLVSRVGEQDSQRMLSPTSLPTNPNSRDLSFILIDLDRTLEEGIKRERPVLYGRRISSLYVRDLGEYGGKKLTVMPAPSDENDFANIHMRYYSFVDSITRMMCAPRQVSIYLPEEFFFNGEEIYDYVKALYE